MNYLLIKNLHTLAALLSISGFALRGYWMFVGSARLEHRITRTAPHVVDTVFLLSGIAMLAILSLNPLTQGWLLAKFAGLLLYILLGVVALRRGPTRKVQFVAFVAALAVFAYIVGAALSKSAASWLRYLV